MNVVDRLKSKRRGHIIVLAFAVAALVTSFAAFWYLDNSFSLIYGFLMILLIAYQAHEAVRVHRLLHNPLLYVLALREEFGEER